MKYIACVAAAYLQYIASCVTAPEPRPCPEAVPCPAAPAAACPGCPACPTCPEPKGPADESAARAFERLLAAVDAGDFAAAWAQLSSDWRARYTPEELAADFRGTESRARERLSRLRAALRAGAPRLVGPGNDRAELPVAEGLTARGVREDGVWKVSSLD